MTELSRYHLLRLFLQEVSDFFIHCYSLLKIQLVIYYTINLYTCCNFFRICHVSFQKPRISGGKYYYTQLSAYQ